MRSEHEREEELKNKIKDLITSYVRKTTTLDELDDLASDLMRKVRDWNKKIEPRCKFCWGVINCTSDHK